MTSLFEAKHPILILFSSLIVLIFNQEVPFQGGRLLPDINHCHKPLKEIFVALVITFQRHYRKSYVNCYLASACVLS